MRVFQINTFCGIKSTGRIATDIALLLEAQGHECRIGFGAENVPKALARFAFRIGSPLERKLHGAVRKFFDAEGYGSHMGTLRLISELKRFQPDVIHLHNIHGCYLHHGLLFQYLKKSKIPVLWTLHDCWPMTGHCAYFEYAHCDKWKDSCGQCPQLRSYPICLWLDGSKRNLRHKKRLFSGLSRLEWVTPSLWLKNYVDMSWLNEYPSNVIYNGVDLSIFKPVDGGELRSIYHIQAKYILLAVAADWDERKGLRYLLEMISRLNGDSGDDSNGIFDENAAYQLVVIGLSKAQMAALPQGVLGIEATQNVLELVKWYSLADCFVNPTMEDNMPMVNLEALACGTPVAVFRTGGCPEVIDETCGQVVEQGNAKALAQAVAKIAPQKAALSQGCLLRAQGFGKDACYGEYLRLYKELMP